MLGLLDARFCNVNAMYHFMIRTGVGYFNGPGLEVAYFERGFRVLAWPEVTFGP